MFPVSVCLRIESKRFVEEETQRKGGWFGESKSIAGLAIFQRRNQDGGTEKSRGITIRLLRGIAP
jgi:hypothetical protein